MLMILGFVSCVEDPSILVSNDLLTGNSGVYILNEGLWGSDNSSLSRIDLLGGMSNNDYFGRANAGLKLGDNAHHIAIKGDTAFIAVSTASTIEVFRLSNGKSLGRIFLPSNSQPRNIVIVNDNLAFVTLLYKSKVIAFDPNTFELDTIGIEVGPFPEYIAYHNGKLFVANSGYGDYYQSKPKAGTISVVDIDTRREVTNLHCGNNVIEVLASERLGRLYACYYNLPSLKDSLGGIVEYDLATFAELRRWRVRATDITLNVAQDTLFFLNGNTDGIKGVDFIDLAEGVMKNLIINPNETDIWYSLAQSPDRASIWVGNARNFRTDGQVLIFPNKPNSTPSRIYKVGVNPNSILFFGQ